MKTIRVYYRTADIKNNENITTMYMDLEVLPEMSEKVINGFLYHDSEYFYSMAEIKTICQLLENIESLKGRTFLTYSIRDIFELD